MTRHARRQMDKTPPPVAGERRFNQQVAAKTLVVARVLFTN